MSADRHPILKKEQERCDALRTGDVDKLADLLSDCLVFMHANAKSDSREMVLDKLRAGNIVYQSLVVSDESVTDLGTTVLLHGRLTALVTVGGQEKRIDNRTLSVWADEGGNWRLVAYQPTPIP